MQVSSGYKTITPVQVANALAAESAGHIDQDALRVYFACFVLQAVREAANRKRRARGLKLRDASRFREDEFESVTVLGCARIRRALRRLQQASLVRYSEAEIFIPSHPVGEVGDLIEAVSGSRSPRRPIPVPRAVLRSLARTRNICLFKTILAYLLRGLSISRSGGAITAKGTVKASWISTTFGISLRSVKYAQNQLRQSGWVSKDTQSFQRKLNRDGAYFVINLEWSGLMRTPGGGSKREVNRIVNSNKGGVDIAPLTAENCTNFARPYKDRKTSLERDQYQKPQPSEARVAGGCGERGEQSPTLSNIQLGDLFHFDRLENLYFEAVERAWIDRSEATALNFIAAAIKAREVGQEPVRLFVAIVRRGLWQNLNQAQEDHARAVLRRRREDNPDRFRFHAARRDGCADTLAA